MRAAASVAGRLSPSEGAIRCGSELREARERLGWDLGEIAAALRIRLAYLQAIEDGRLSALPGNTYALGFLRTYATTLGLDADEVARRFRAETADVNRRTELAFPSPVPERGVPTGAAVLLGFAVVLVAYVAWFHWSARERAPNRTVPPVPAQLLPAHRPAPVSPQVASVMPATPAPALPGITTPAAAPPAGSSPLRAPTSGAGTPAAVAAAPTGTAPDVAPSVPGTGAATTPTGGLAPAAPAATPAGATPTATAPGGSALALQATAPTWLEIRDASGAVLFDRVLQPGEHWTAPGDPGGLVFTTGNAGGLELVRNGVAGPPLGRTGAVLRHVALAAATSGVAATTSPPSTAPPAPAAVSTVPAGATPGQAGQRTGVSTAAAATTAAAPPTPRHHPAPPPPANADDSADALNARELGAHTGAAPTGR